MAFDNDAYERKQHEVHETNETHLANFIEWLKNKGLTDRTINNHIANVDFYINHYLCYYDVQDVRQGCYKISRFLGDWFIRKALWSSCANIKSSAASIKKFYKLMLENNVINQEDYNELCETIKDEMPDWLDEMSRYDNMAEDYSF